MSQRPGGGRTQAEGVARALGNEFGEHVVARGDLDARFDRVDAETTLMRTQFEARIDSVRSDIGSRLDALDAKFNVMGRMAGLALAFLTLLVTVAGIGVYNPPIQRSAAPPATVFGRSGRAGRLPRAWSPSPPR